MLLPPSATGSSRSRWWLPVWACAVAALHGLLWDGVSEAMAASPATDRHAPAVQVRTVELPLAKPQTPAPVPVVARPRLQPVAQRMAQPTQVPPQEPPQPQPPEPGDAVLVAAALPAVPAAGPQRAVPADDVPVYKTQPPPPMQLSYEMHSGRWRGTGQLHWRPSAAGYEARMEGRLVGFRILSWVSQGGIDAAGLAPLRFTDERRGRGMQAANFQRPAGKISFSGSATEYPLLRGAQDRLSWMVQMAAIALADPQRLVPGARVALFVAGARGDADVWAFHVEAVEDVSTGDATVRAVKLVREPRKPHDTRVEVWLAPSLHYLPVRARLIDTSSTLELLLQAAQAPV